MRKIIFSIIICLPIFVSAQYAIPDSIQYIEVLKLSPVVSKSIFISYTTGKENQIEIKNTWAIEVINNLALGWEVVGQFGEAGVVTTLMKRKQTIIQK